MILDEFDNNIAPFLRAGIWEPRSTEHLLNIIKDGDVFIDCGAHWGYYTLLASELVGNNGLVFSFEPIMRNFMYLVTNIAINDLTNVRPLRIALWDIEINLPLIPEHVIGRSGGAHVLRNTDNPYTAEWVCTATLDAMFKPEEVDFIKIDCEGSDARILAGAREILNTGHAKLMVENPSLPTLAEFGYEVRARFEKEQTYFLEKR